MMELPNYNRQLMHQLWALRKEGHFCDCTILVGDDPHQAHKVVLAASSMLFRSLLDGSDAVSIDPAVVSSQEFACLLDMIYTGKLPLGKHNVSRIIAAADTLQMFDVAVGFKNVLSTLVPSAQTPTAPPGSKPHDSDTPPPPHMDASHHTPLELQPEKEEGQSDDTPPPPPPPPPPPACKRTCPEHSESSAKGAAGIPQGRLTSDEPSQTVETGSMSSESVESKPSEDESTSGALERSSELKQLLTNMSPAAWQQLSRAAGSNLDGRDSQVVLTCCEATDCSSAAQQLMSKVDEGLLGEDALLRLLRSLQQKDPPSAAPAASLSQEEEEEEEEEEKKKKKTTTQDADGTAEIKMSVNQSEDDVKGDDKTEAEEDSSPSSSPSSRYSCRWCRKGFAYKCRKVAHEKRCPLSQHSELQCPDCPQKLANQRALQRHRLEAHRTNTRSKKKVACDLCGRTFAHPSGMIYHKRTEHFEERPFSCSECGAKFGANSSLKNHMRLHTGEKPYVCKHCDMSFSVAAALAYHTKKKHSEGKMYVCQYCKAVFAQSIELTRHVRTHTGDRPYVCRECGKGYSQASGLTVHLHTFHNVSEPHDCQRCCLSFSSLEEHRQHVEDVHQREFHTCPVCNKVFTSAALLDKHVSSHTGGKPFRCDLCNKSYQQVSGLWYHNRTNHPDVFASQTRQLKTLLQCDVCFKFFPSAGSLTEHRAAEHQGSAASSVRCPQCPAVLGGSEQLQEHVSSQHAHACPLCPQSCSSSLELQQHVLSQHVQEKTEASDMVVSEDGVLTLAAAGGSEDASQLAAAQQVLVALAGGGGSSAEVVEVNMYDLLSSSVTFICEDKQDVEDS